MLRMTPFPGTNERFVMAGAKNACEYERDHELAWLRSLTLDSVQSLKSHWVVTVEQFVAAAATAQGRKGLESLLGNAGASVVGDALREASDLLGRERYETLMQAKPGGPLGARFDEPALGGSKGGAT